MLLVVHCHVLDFQLYYKQIALQQRFFYLQNFGAAGVDIFFVISGFIITIISTKYINGKAGYFFLKRMIRVIPLYWLATLLISCFSYVYWHKLQSIHAVLATLVFFPFLNAVPNAHPLLFQGWTLSFELIFYMVTALAMLSGKRTYMLMTIVFFTACLLLHHLLGINNVVIHFLGNGIMLEFLLGVLAGMVFLARIRVPRQLAMLIFLCGIAGFFASLVWGYGNISEAPATIDGTLSLRRSIVWGVPAALLVTGLVLREKAQPMHVPLFWIAIGNASYSIYLLHPFVLQFIYNRHMNPVLQILPPDMQVLVGMATAIAGGYLFYRFVELPLLRWFNSRFQLGGRQKNAAVNRL